MVWHNDQVSELETSKLLSLAERCLGVEGDFVELGCYKGDTSLMLADLLAREHSNKKLWLYDSFEGLPEKTEEDTSAAGQEFKKGELYVTKREVKARFLRANLPVPIIKKAWFGELSSIDMPAKVAFAFVDGDLYESIRDSLRLLEGKIAKYGVVVVHDYSNPALPGVAKAVDEWTSRMGVGVTLYQSMVIIEMN